MEKRRVGLTDIFVSTIGLGCASYWGKEQFDENKAISIVHKAIEKGVNLFDTGHSYSNGNAEIRLKKALKGINNKENLVISTKAGTRIGRKGQLYKDFSPQWIRKSCQQSLTTLGVDSISLFHLHGPNIKNFTPELLDELTKLKAEGLIQAYGVNSFDEEVLQHILQMDFFDFVMPDYNVLSLEREPLIDSFFQKGIGVLAGAALANSLFSNRIFKIRKAQDLWYLLRAIKNFRSKLLKGMSYRFMNQYDDITGAQIALAYVIQNKNVVSAVFGTTDEKHLNENLQASEIMLPKNILNEIHYRASKRG